MQPKEALIVGLGNPLLGDDGFGSRVAHRLRRARGAGVAFDVVEAGTDLAGRLDALAAYATVVLVDALLDETNAGTVRRLGEAELVRWDGRSRSVHELSVTDAVRLYRVLYPASRTRFVLVALSTDRITRRPVHATASAVREGARRVLEALA